MKIIPAILENNIEEIKSKLKAVKGIVSVVQIDIGDGQFVPNKFGCLKSIKMISSKPSLEIHLMTEKPWDKLSLLKNRNIKNITFHYEAFLKVPKKTRSFAINNLVKKIRKIRDDIQIGIAINPETNPVAVLEFLDRVDEVLLLGVTPGKQSQKFQEDVLLKINYLRNLKENLLIGIDGGVNDKNIQQIASASVDKIYIGSFLWKHHNLKNTIEKLES